MPELTCDLEKLQAGLVLAASSITAEGQTPPPIDPEEPPPPVQHTPPVAFGDAVSTPQDTAVTFNVLANDQAGDGTLDTLTLMGDAEHGNLEVQGGNVTYHPDAGFSGADDFTYNIVDSNGLTSNIATVAITVTPVEPPPPPQPQPLAMKLTGFHPAHGTHDGVPVDVMASLTGCDNQLRPRNPSQIVGLWPLMERWRLLQPGKGMPTNIFQRLTDNNQIGLVCMPMLVRDPVDNGGKGGEGDWDSVVRGSNNAFYDTFFEWIDRQGQKDIRIRLGHEQGSTGWFPHSIGQNPRALIDRRDFSGTRAATEYIMKRAKKLLPRAKIVYSHFWQCHIKVSPTEKRFYHPDEFAPDPRLYDIGSVDWYDGKGQPISAANCDAMESQTHTIAEFGNKKAPWGVLAWEKYFKDLGKTAFAVCESGIVCEGPSQPERDNPFFIERMFKLNRDRNWAHCCYFNPHDRNGAHRIKDGTLAGTRKATDKYIQLYRGSA